MAIGSVFELVDYKQETIKLAKKYGGGELEPRVQELELEVGQLSASVLSITGDIDKVEDAIEDIEDSIADAYNPNRTTGYSIGDVVIYEDKLYKCTSPVSVGAGEFDNTKWDAIPTYDSTQTYNEYDYVVYEGVPYRCDEANTTGEWDSSKWTDVSIEFAEYDETATYYMGSRVEYDGGYYRANATYSNAGTVGEFNTNKWAETTIESLVDGVKVIKTSALLNELSTDANGCILDSAIRNVSAVSLTGKSIFHIYHHPYAGQAPATTSGYIFTQLNSKYWLVESVAEGVKTVATSVTFGSGDYISIYAV